MPFGVKAIQRNKQVDDAQASRYNDAGIRHDQVVGCNKEMQELTSLKCYFNGYSPLAFAYHRLTYWLFKKPPLEAAYDKASDYLDDYNNWRSGVLNWWYYLFASIPFSSTEDRKGTVETNTPLQNKLTGSGDDEVTVTNITYTPNTDGEGEILYFPHMQEVSELAAFLQKTFVPQGNSGSDNSQQDSDPPAIGPGCTILESRTNPG